MNETKEKVKHSPTPWSLGKYIEAAIRSGDDVIAKCLGPNDLNVNETNAAFIVRAVNAHDELVAALKQMKIAMKNFLTLEGGIEKSAMEAADKALAAAEGR